MYKEQSETIVKIRICWSMSLEQINVAVTARVVLKKRFSKKTNFSSK